MSLSSLPLILSRTRASVNILGVLMVWNAFLTGELRAQQTAECINGVVFAPPTHSVSELPMAAQTAVKRPLLSLTFNSYSVASAT